MSRIQERVAEAIARHGWHVVLVAEGDPGEPPFAYTVGLGKTFGHPELIVIGLAPEGAHALLNELGERVRGGVELKTGDDISGIIEGYACRIGAVDPLWRSEYVGQALAFYDPAPVSVLQCLWPDKAGKFPPDPEFAAALRVRQPWLASTWHFDVPRNVATVTTEEVVSGAPALLVSHDEDGTWQVLGRGPVSADRAKLVALGSLVEKDPTLAFVASLPRGWTARRAAADEPWERSQD